MDKVQQLNNVNNRLITIEQCGNKGTKDDAAAATVVKELEAQSRHVIEDTAHLPTREGKQLIVLGCLRDHPRDEKHTFATPPKTGPSPKAPLLAKDSSAPISYPIFQPHYRKLSVPTFNGKEHPLPWLNRCEFFRISGSPTTKRCGMHLFN
jgi:hypothetical protein